MRLVPMNNNVELYISPDGDDTWSGTLSEPDSERRDGPFATIERAQAVVRQLRSTGRARAEVTVWLRGGTFPIREPLEFTPEDSSVAYRAFDGEQPILDGGIRIGGWRVEPHGDSVCWAVDLPDVAAGRWYFRQLFVNGGRRTRARLPKQGLYRIADVPGVDVDAPLQAGSDGFIAAPGDLQLWRNLTDVEMVVVHYWVEERMPIVAFDPATGLVRSSRRSRFVLSDDFLGRWAPYYVDNVGDALSEPGEWYLERRTGTLRYLPFPGEQPDTADVVAPLAQQFVKVRGQPDAGVFVENLSFAGLTFRHGDWRQPDGRGASISDSGKPLNPNINFATASQAARNVPGVISLEGARNCAIENCTIEHIGSYAIDLRDGCMGNRIVGNTVRDVGAGGIKIDGAPAGGSVARQSGINGITDNHIYDAGHVFHGAVGIVALHSFGNDISYNHLHDLHYTAISVGYVWGYGEHIARDNRIASNEIHDLGKGLLSDMGGVYTLGVQPGTVVRGNRIRDVQQRTYGGWGIYLDEGSSHIVVEQNLCLRTGSASFNLHYGRENMIRNNIFVAGREGIVGLPRAEPHCSAVLLHNLLIADGEPIFAKRFVQPELPRIISDLNLVWDLAIDPPCLCRERAGHGQDAATLREYSLAQWQQLGHDRFSIAADPHFAGTDVSDGMLRDDSPAAALGFEPSTPLTVGPRQRERRR